MFLNGRCKKSKKEQYFFGADVAGGDIHSAVGIYCFPLKMLQGDFQSSFFNRATPSGFARLFFYLFLIPNS